MWTYHQKSGELIGPDGVVIAIGYSGRDEGKNNPLFQYAKGHGPIPQGMWTIAGHYNSQKVGPFALTLEPKPGTETHGRGDFRIHGDSKRAPGTASDGCIIVPRSARNMVWESGDRDLKVIP